jgi:hypothetical protein
VEFQKMKAVLAVLTPAVLLVAGPALAADAQDVLKASLVSATRQEMSVAPWVGISVTEQVRGDKLVWVAHTGGGQRYACSAPASADAVLSGEVSCLRLKAAQSKSLNNGARLYALSQRAKLPFPGQAITTYDYLPASR